MTSLGSCVSALGLTLTFANSSTDPTPTAASRSTALTALSVMTVVSSLRCFFSSGETWVTGGAMTQAAPGTAPDHEVGSGGGGGGGGARGATGAEPGIAGAAGAATG